MVRSVSQQPAYAQHRHTTAAHRQPFSSSRQGAVAEHAVLHRWQTDLAQTKVHMANLTSICVLQDPYVTNALVTDSSVRPLATVVAP